MAFWMIVEFLNPVNVKLRIKCHWNESWSLHSVLMGKISQTVSCTSDTPSSRILKAGGLHKLEFKVLRCWSSSHSGVTNILWLYCYDSHTVTRLFYSPHPLSWWCSCCLSFIEVTVWIIQWPLTNCLGWIKA